MRPEPRSVESWKMELTAAHWFSCVAVSLLPVGSRRDGERDTGARPTRLEDTQGQHIASVTSEGRKPYDGRVDIARQSFDARVLRVVVRIDGDAPGPRRDRRPAPRRVFRRSGPVPGRALAQRLVDLDAMISDKVPNAAASRENSRSSRYDWANCSCCVIGRIKGRSGPSWATMRRMSGARRAGSPLARTSICSSDGDGTCAYRK